MADCCDEAEDELDLLCWLELLDEDDCVLDCCVLLCLSSFELWCDCEDEPPDAPLCCVTPLCALDEPVLLSCFEEADSFLLSGFEVAEVAVSPLVSVAACVESTLFPLTALVADCCAAEDCAPLLWALSLPQADMTAAQNERQSAAIISFLFIFPPKNY